jgi:hypothetical protein
MSYHSIQGQDCHGKGSFALVTRYWHFLTFEPQLDAGMHPAFDGLAALPFYDDFDLSTVDVLLISQ